MNFIKRFSLSIVDTVVILDIRNNTFQFSFIAFFFFLPMLLALIYFYLTPNYLQQQGKGLKLKHNDIQMVVLNYVKKFRRLKKL